MNATETYLHDRITSLEGENAYLRALLTAVPAADRSMHHTAHFLLTAQAQVMEQALALLTGPQRLDITLQQLYAQTGQLRLAAQKVLHHYPDSERERDLA